MGKANAYQCDSPECDELTSRPSKHRYPKNWVRVTMLTPLGHKHAGSFCSDECVSAWVADLMTDERVSELEPLEAEVG